ncbi:MAG TPA: condensation domain-containing protein, partial [Ktedonobacteraceae bacterium]|nr:condensation domain-containing protein [Ktedonobacteraceae bacterium]
MREDGNVVSDEKFCPPLASCLTLVDILQWRALWQPEQLAYTFLADGETGEEHLSYGELDRRARAIAGRLQRYTEVGSCVLLLYPPGLDYIAAFMGCLYAGTIAVPAYPPSSRRSLTRIQTIVGDAQTRIVLTTSEIASHVARWAAMLPEIRDLQWLATDSVSDEQEDPWRKYQPAPERVALLQYTSGSTSNPKGVMVSHGNLMHNSAMMRDRWGHSASSRGVSWLPMFHDMGLIAGVLQPLYVGFPAVLMAPVAFIQRPLRWLQAISRYRGTTSCAPNFAYELCIRRVTEEEKTQLDLSSWAVAVNGAEPVRAETIEHFVGFFKPCGLRPEAICPGYGLAEGTLMVSCTSVGALPRVFSFAKAQFEHHSLVEIAKDQGAVQTLVGCGAAASDQRVAIVHPETLKECAPGEIGEIWLAGPSVALGYWQRLQETERTFQAFLPGGEGPFLRTGDLGCLQAGELCVTGRLKDLIIIRGRNYYPQDIELVVEQSHSALRPGCGAAFSVEIANQEQLVVIHEAARHIQQPDEICKAMRRAVAEVYELQVHAVVLLRPGSVLKTSSGKIQRRACREAFLLGQLQVVASDILQEPAPLSPAGGASAAFLSRAAILALDPAEQRLQLQAFLLSHLRTVLGVESQRIDLFTPISALGLDSLRAIELQAWFEEHWACVIPFTDLLDGLSIAELTDALLIQLCADSESAAKAISLRSTDERTVYPLSSAQEQLWVLYQLEPASSFYTIPLALKMTGVLKSGLLVHCLEQLIERHDLLRATFQRRDGQVVQCIQAEPAVAITVVDLSGLHIQTELPSLLQQAVQKPFDITQNALLRVMLVRLGPTEHIFLLAIHHIISDGWSVRLLIWELTHLYAARLQEENASPLAPLSLCYADYVRWQRARAESQEVTLQLAYWKQQLAHLPVLELPTDRARPSAQSYRGAKTHFVVSHQIKQSIAQIARQEGTTLFTVFLASFYASLLRYTGQNDLVIGTVVANRQKAELQGLVGFLVNTLVLRVRIEPGWSFRTLLQRVRFLCLETYKHQDVPFPRLVEELRPERDLGRNPLFQVVCTWQPDVFERLEIPELTLESYDIPGTTARFDLSLDFFERETSVLGVVEYATDLFDAGTIEWFIGYFQNLLTQVVASPDQPLLQLEPGALEIYDQTATKPYLPEIECPTTTTVHDLFASQAAQSPDAIAVVYGETCLTYSVLDQRAAHLASYLRSQGIVAHERVGICLGRSLDLIIALLGVLKVGGTYIPLDPSYPRARLALMIEGVTMKIILSHSQYRDQLSSASVQIAWLDSGWRQIAEQRIDQSEEMSQ